MKVEDWAVPTPRSEAEARACSPLEMESNNEIGSLLELEGRRDCRPLLEVEPWIWPFMEDREEAWMWPILERDGRRGLGPFLELERVVNFAYQ